MSRCSYCNKEQVVAKGLCRACYYRQKRTGTLEYKYRGKPKAACQHEGCELPVVAKGYCDKHYRHFAKHNDAVSPFGYGERRKHPLYEIWRGQLRAAAGRSAEWDDFWVFVEDVGEKPDGNFTAKRYDANKPWSPDNFYWHEKIASSADRVEYSRQWRRKNPLMCKDTALKKSFGIGLEEYTRMYESQNGRCALCGKPGKPYDRDSGRSETLVVDHCHGSSRVRSLLCPACNKGLGAFNDSEHLLRMAIKYLRKHR